MQQEEYLAGIIRKMIEEKRLKHLVPHCILFSELSNEASMPLEELRKTLNTLYVKGLITVYRTINEQAIEWKN